MRVIAILPPRMSERGVRLRLPGATSLPLSDDELRRLRDVIDQHLEGAPDTTARLRRA